MITAHERRARPRIQGLRSSNSYFMHAEEAEEGGPESLEDDPEDQGPSLSSLIARRWQRLSCQRLFNPAFFGSVCTSLGQRAFFAMTFMLSAVALVGQRVARALRASDLSNGLPKWADDLLVKFRMLTGKTIREVTGRLRYESVVTRMFAMAAGEDQKLDQVELYCMCLELYCMTTQYMPQVLTPPTRSHTDSLFLTFDTDKSGFLDREEFIALASVFYEHLLMRIAAQSVISLLLAPLTASAIVGRLAALHLGAQGEAAGAAMGSIGVANRTLGDAAYDALPEKLQPLVGSQGIATTSLAATLVATLVPATLSLTDEYYLLRAARKTSRRLVRRRTLRATHNHMAPAPAPALKDAQEPLGVANVVMAQTAEQQCIAYVVGVPATAPATCVPETEDESPEQPQTAPGLADHQPQRRAASRTASDNSKPEAARWRPSFPLRGMFIRQRKKGAMHIGQDLLCDPMSPG